MRYDTVTDAVARPFSPSAIGRYRTCPALFWFERHDDGSDELPCDDFARRFGIAMHEGFRAFHRWLRVSHRRLPAHEEARARLLRECRERVRRGCSDDARAARERFEQALPGIGASLAARSPR